MESDIWFMVAWIVSRHGADAPRIAEEVAERVRREQGTDSSDFEAWLAIRDAAVEWFEPSRSALDVVH